MLQVQQEPKEGILSWAQPTTTKILPKSPTRPTSPRVRERSQEVKRLSTPRDPGKSSRVTTRDPSPDPSRAPSRDVKITPPESRARSRDQANVPSRDRVAFGKAMRPLTGVWKTVGTNQRLNKVNRISPAREISGSKDNSLRSS